MNRLLSAELIKLRHRWMPRILILIMIGIIALVIFGISTSSEQSDVLLPRGPLLGLAFSGFFAPFLWPVLAGAWAGNEYSWGTMRLILTRRPNRLQQAAAALILMIAVVVLALLIALVLGIVEGFIVQLVTSHGANTKGIGSDFGLVVIKAFVAEVYVIFFYVVVAYAAGTIFQSPAAGIGIGIGSWIAQLIVSGIFRALSGTWVQIANHFPNTYAASLPEKILAPVFPDGLMSSGSSTAGVIPSIIGLAVYMLVILGIMTYVVKVRDVTA